MFSLLGFYHFYINLSAYQQKQLFSKISTTTPSLTQDIIINQFILNTPVKDTLALTITASQAVIIRKNNTIHCTDVTGTIFDAHGTMQDINLKGTCFVYNLTNNLITSSKPIEIKTKYATFTGLNAKFDILKKHFTMDQCTTLITLSSDSQPIP